jgi:hypothetical protein
MSITTKSTDTRLSDKEMTMGIREAFVARFDEDMACAIEAAATEHHPEDKRGSDAFRWACVVCIGFQCFEKDQYREAHGITKASYVDIRDWLIEHGDIANHDGDCDYLALFAGMYNQYTGQGGVE